jgi:hypothetical protein
VVVHKESAASPFHTPSGGGDTPPPDYFSHIPIIAKYYELQTPSIHEVYFLKINHENFRLALNGSFSTPIAPFRIAMQLP